MWGVGQPCDNRKGSRVCTLRVGGELAPLRSAELRRSHYCTAPRGPSVRRSAQCRGTMSHQQPCALDRVSLVEAYHLYSICCPLRSLSLYSVWTVVVSGGRVPGARRGAAGRVRQRASVWYPPPILDLGLILTVSHEVLGGVLSHTLRACFRVFFFVAHTYVSHAVNPGFLPPLLP